MSHRNSFAYSAGDLELDLNLGLGLDSRCESPHLFSVSSSTAPSMPVPTASNLYDNTTNFPSLSLFTTNSSSSLSIPSAFDENNNADFQF